MQIILTETATKRHITYFRFYLLILLSPLTWQKNLCVLCVQNKSRGFTVTNQLSVVQYRNFVIGFHFPYRKGKKVKKSLKKKREMVPKIPANEIQFYVRPFPFASLIMNVHVAGGTRDATYRIATVFGVYYIEDIANRPRTPLGTKPTTLRQCGTAFKARFIYSLSGLDSPLEAFEIKPVFCLFKCLDRRLRREDIF